MNSRHLRTFLIAAGVVFALPAHTTRAFADQSCAQPGAPGMMPPPGVPGDMGMAPRPPMRGPEAGGLPPHLRGLDLSAAQRDRIAEIQCGLMTAMRARSEEAERAHRALRELAMSDAYDEVQARRLVEAAGAAMTELALARTRADNAMFLILTPEQRTRLKERGDCPRSGDGPPMPPMRGF